MEQYFNTIFEDIRREKLLILILSLTDPGILRKIKFTDDKMNLIKNLAIEKLHRQRILKEYHAVSLLE